MTRAQTHAYWIGPPSATQLWLGTMLRAFAMLVSSVAAFVRMRPSLLSRECHTDVEPDALPERESGIIEETDKAAGRSYRASRATAIPPMATTTIFDGLPDDDDFRHGAGRRFLPAAPDDNDDDDCDLQASTTILGVADGIAYERRTDIERL